MSRRYHRAVRLCGLLALVLAVGAGGCGGGETRARGGAAATRPAAAVDGGRLVAIGGGRSLYLRCVGSGNPTVVLEGGDAGYAAQWHDVQPQLGRSTRVCAYDRAGAGQSLPTHGLRDARDEVSDLRRLLAHAPIEPPIVLAGHSYGGVLTRVFAHENPTLTAGLVLIETMGHDGRRRQLAAWPESQAPEVRALLATTLLQDVDLTVGERLASRIRSFGHKPLAVIDAGRHSVLDPAPARLQRTLNGIWARMHVELAHLSDNSVHVTALRSDHDVASARDGQPAVVIAAVQAVVHAVREGVQLRPCSRIFSGPDVRCRS
jgi:pimeloyl-ACP methyl ester carboxylesterase